MAQMKGGGWKLGSLLCLPPPYLILPSLNSRGIALKEHTTTHQVRRWSVGLSLPLSLSVLLTIFYEFPSLSLFLSSSFFTFMGFHPSLLVGFCLMPLMILICTLVCSSRTHLPIMCSCLSGCLMKL